MDFVLGIILLILIIYSYGRHKKNGQYEIWLEKYNQGYIMWAALKLRV